MLRNSTSSNQRISVTSDSSGGSGGTLWCRILLFLVLLTGEETDETDESKRFFAPRAAPHTKPGVDSGNGAFCRFVLALNKQLPRLGVGWGLGWIFSQNVFRFVFLCLFDNVCL